MYRTFRTYGLKCKYVKPSRHTARFGLKRIKLLDQQEPFNEVINKTEEKPDTLEVANVTATIATNGF